MFDTVTSEVAGGSGLTMGAAGRAEVMLSERPTSFSYRAGALPGPLGVLAADAVGWWTFEPDGAGSRLAWTTSFTPRSRLARAPLRAYLRMRRARAMNRALDRCIALALSRIEKDVRGMSKDGP